MCMPAFECVYGGALVVNGYKDDTNGGLVSGLPYYEL